MKDIQELLGKRIRGLRNKAGLTIAQLAEKANLSDNFIGCIERGERSPTLKTLEKVASALGVEIADLFVFSPKKKLSDAEEIKIRVEKLIEEKDDRTLQLVSRILRDVMEWSEEM
jgi:transcriptional regulator with XRE-family HTH domain